jgi:hypothetical protein
MPRVRFLLGLLVLLAGFACGRETFDLLPPDEEADARAGDGPVGSGGSAGGGFSGSAGGFPTGGHGGYGGYGGYGGRDEPPLPTPDCPDDPDLACSPCHTSRDCVLGTLCDTFRHYCAPYCDDETVFCNEPSVPACDRDRHLCVECTIPTHCGGMLKCMRGKCEPGTPPECFSNSQCTNPSQPVCVDYFCRPCFNDEQCGPGMHCDMSGRCEADLPRP